MRTFCGPLVALLSIGIVLDGCAGPKLEPPTMLAAPYEAPQLWAVAPFNNESGTTLVETHRVADLFAEQLQQVEGLDAVPVNRVIAAMRQLEMERIESSHDAGMLLRTLGVDGLIVGTITAYDAYPPPKLGAAIQLYRGDDHRSYSDLDPRALTKAPTDSDLTFATAPPDIPVAQAAGVFDASNHQTLQWLRDYAKGRTEPDSAYGERAYLVSMELFTEFTSHRLIRDLLDVERTRISPTAHADAR